MDVPRCQAPCHGLWPGLFRVRPSWLPTSCGWHEDTIDGNGQLVNPPDPLERIEAVAGFPEAVGGRFITEIEYNCAGNSTSRKQERTEACKATPNHGPHLRK
jgi:hypothetical protein